MALTDDLSKYLKSDIYEDNNFHAHVSMKINFEDPVAWSMCIGSIPACVSLCICIIQLLGLCISTRYEMSRSVSCKANGDRTLWGRG